MVGAVNSYAVQSEFRGTIRPRTESPSTEKTPFIRRDSVAFGNASLTTSDAQRVLLERALDKLRSVVGEARAALGLPDEAVLDTSPEATADRIADFALGFFDRYALNHGLADDEAGRQRFVDFIGGAIAQGISEARNILGALNALNADISSNIDTTAAHIETRLSDFVQRGRG